MRGSGSIAGASAYGTISRTPRTSSPAPLPRASPSNVIDVDAINDNDGAKAPATSTSARRCRLVASAPTRLSQPLDPFEAPNYSQSTYAGSAKENRGPSSKAGKGGVSSHEEFAGIAPSGRVVISGATTGLEVLEQALAGLPVPESIKRGRTPARMHPKLCKLYGPPPPVVAEYYRRQCSSLAKSGTHSNSLNEWAHEEWFNSDEDLACYSGYDD